MPPYVGGMRICTALIAVALCLVFAPGASALPPECPLPMIPGEDPCGGEGGGEDPATLLVDISTSPVATSASPGWDDENLTYTATITNNNSIHNATSVVVTSEFTQGSASLVSSSASQGSCTGLTCNLGTIAVGEFATVTIVVDPSAGTLKNRFTADATGVGSDSEIQTNTIRSSTASAAIDWSMPERSRDANGDGLIDVGAPAGGYTPSSWSVVLNGCGSAPGRKTISQYKWEVEGLPEQVTSNCQHTIQVPREQIYPTKLTVTMTDGTSVVANRDIKVVDRFIVVMGDSYASGEGNPHSFIQYGSGSVLQPATWEDSRCHRSMWASSARAARILEVEDPHSSVTYLSKACSGAQIAEGILGGYKGVEPVGTTLLPPQLAQVREVVGNARIDDLLISIGGNDAGFAKIIADCMLPGDCFNNTTLVADHNTAIAGLNTSHYPAMRAAIKNQQTGLNAASTFITEYPDFTTNASGNPCETMGADILWPLSINEAEAAWASNTVLANITNMLKNQVNLAKADGDDWNYVGGVQDAWTQPGQFGHGYCVGDPGVRDPNRWVRTFKDSCDLQGPPAGYVFGAYYCHADKTTGQFHPNETGHAAIGQRYLVALRAKPPGLDPVGGGGDPGGGDPGGGDPGGGDPGGGDPGGGDPGGGDPGSGDPGSGDPGSGDPGSGDPGNGGNLPELPNGNPTVGGNLPGGVPVTGGTPSPGTPARKPGKCAKLKGKKRAKCVKKACARYNGRTRKAKLKYKSCVKAVTRKG